jgi:hypothetical protein
MQEVAGVLGEQCPGRGVLAALDERTMVRGQILIALGRRRHLVEIAHCHGLSLPMPCGSR